MSVTELIRNTEVQRRLDKLLPRTVRFQRAILRVPSVSGSPSLAGVAFDYAARLEFAYRAPDAEAGEWLAEGAAGCLPSRSMERRDAKTVVDAARTAQERLPLEDSRRWAEIAVHAARLAQLDNAARTRGAIMPTFGEKHGVPERAIADEVKRMLMIAEPLFALSSEEPVLLNPSFGWLGGMVGGGDADLILGDTLVELKTAQSSALGRDQLRQCIAYAALASGSGTAYVDSIAVYFARFGVLRVVPLRKGMHSGELLATALWLAGVAGGGHDEEREE